MYIYKRLPNAALDSGQRLLIQLEAREGLTADWHTLSLGGGAQSWLNKPRQLLEHISENTESLLPFDNNNVQKQNFPVHNNVYNKNCVGQFCKTHLL